nr:MAG TPA: hypothetical protein [Caudoviricetes sp.]
MFLYTERYLIKHMLKKYMPIIIILNIKYNVNNC